MRAEVIHRVIPGPIEKNRDQSASHFVGAALTRRNVAGGSHRREGEIVVIRIDSHHPLRCTIESMAKKSMPNASPSKPIRLLVLDIDGTVTNSRHEVTDATCRAIERVRAAGVRVMLATGRRYRDALPVVKQLGIVEPVVTASGALIKRPGDHATLHCATFAHGVLARVLVRIVDHGHEPVVYTDSFAEDFDFHCQNLQAAATWVPGRGGFGEYLSRNAALARLTPDLWSRPPADAFASFVMGGREPMQAIEADLKANFAGTISVHTIRSPRYSEWLCEIAPVGITKWTGVMALAADWGISAEEVCAVGDDANDLPMVQAAGLGIAMGNGRPELQEAADLVVGPHDGSGIEDVSRLVLARATQSAEPA